MIPFRHSNVNSSSLEKKMEEKQNILKKVYFSQNLISVCQQKMELRHNFSIMILATHFSSFLFHIYK